MKVDLTPMVHAKNTIRVIPVVLEADTFTVPKGGTCPIRADNSFDLEIANHEGSELRITGEADLVAQIPCGRCLMEVRTPIHLSIDKRLKLQGERLVDDDMEEGGCLDGYELDIEKLACTEILVNWPMKVLCRDDCKGICRYCGKNLNEGVCGCQRTELDPRMAAIQDVFNKFKEV